jgi:hypothetical protein
MVAEAENAVTATEVEVFPPDRADDAVAWACG